MAFVSKVPQWTEQVLASGGGQDHLGIGSVVTDRILPKLLPGINALTPHPRYWSFYAFVLDEFWNRGENTGSRKALNQFIREKEFIFSVAGQLCDNPNHRTSQEPIGSRLVSPLVQGNPTSYTTTFNYIKASGGGYGLYYARAMETGGVVKLADPSLNLPIDAVTPIIGKEIAHAFRESISQTTYWKKYFNKNEIPTDVVLEYASVACLCRLNENTPDRSPLLNAFLHGGINSDSESRRSSIRMMLELAKQTNGVAINDADFRRLMVYGSAYDLETDERTANFSAPEALRSTARGWRLSQLREIFNLSLNGMWALIHEWGMSQRGDFSPKQTSELIEFLSRADISAVPGLSIRNHQPVTKLIEKCKELSMTTNSVDGEWDLWAALTEDHLLTLLEDAELPFETRMGMLFTLYVMTLGRLHDPALPLEVGAEDWSPVTDGGRRRISMQFALSKLREDSRDHKSIGESLLRVVNEQVLAQHDRVAMGKLPEDTFRFRREGTRIRFFDRPTKYGRNNSRFNSLSTTCAELGLSGFLADEQHRLSAEGETIRSKGDLALPVRIGSK